MITFKISNDAQIKQQISNAQLFQILKMFNNVHSFY